MNLREAAGQALDALIWTTGSEDFSENGKAREGALNLLFPAITALRDALAEDSMQRLTDVQQEMEAALADQATYGMSITLGGKRIDPASIYKQEVPQDHNADANKMVDVQQEMDCYGDGNVYRGQRSKDSKTQTITFSKVETVEPVAWMRADRGHVDFHRHPDYLPLYTTAPPKRKPLTESFLEELAEKHVTNCYFDTLTYARAIEWAHDIGGEE